MRYDDGCSAHTHRAPAAGAVGLSGRVALRKGSAEMVEATAVMPIIGLKTGRKILVERGILETDQLVSALKAEMRNHERRALDAIATMKPPTFPSAESIAAALEAALEPLVRRLTKPPWWRWWGR